MTDHISATRTIDAPASAIFAVLTDPDRHQETEPGDWVRGAIDPQPLTEVGQVFGIDMFHEFQGGEYEMWNRLSVLEPDRAIAWRPGMKGDDGEVQYGGHEWRYDLKPAGDGSSTEVTLTYDWTDMPQELRERIGKVPPVDVHFLDDSLGSLAEATSRG